MALMAQDREIVERYLKPPEDRILDDRLVQGIQLVRFWFGVSIAMLVEIPRSVAHDVALINWLGNWLASGVVKLLAAPFLLLVTLPPVVAAFVLLLVPGADRRRMVGRLRGPAVAVGMFVAHWLLLVATAIGPFLLGHSTNALVGGVAFLAGLPLLLRAIGFVSMSVPCIARYMFRTMEIHQALPALLTVVLSWELLLLGELFPVRIVSDGYDSPLWLSLGGALATTAVAVWEIGRLRARHGIRLRTLPPAPRARPE
ncbi:hypothetical protein ACFYZN_05080 [Streptomyces sp. NPDC001777]|uniref:hypothetical protein n=1 Tax=Streptomyces sp. NPDC001777 TaxID=3364608 RepID=UPI0036938F4A